MESFGFEPEHFLSSWSEIACESRRVTPKVIVLGVNCGISFGTKFSSGLCILSVHFWLRLFSIYQNCMQGFLPLKYRFLLADLIMHASSYHNHLRKEHDIWLIDGKLHWEVMLVRQRDTCTRPFIHHSTTVGWTMCPFPAQFIVGSSNFRYFRR